MILGGIARLIVRDLLDVVDPKDLRNFCESREARFGMSLEAVQQGRETRVADFRASLLLPVRLVLGRQKWARRRHSELCRPHHLRHPAMAALCELVRTGGSGRPDRGLA